MTTQSGQCSCDGWPAGFVYTMRGGQLRVYLDLSVLIAPGGMGGGGG